MNTKYLAPFVIRFYVWELLKRNSDMIETQYNNPSLPGDGMIPIVPLGEEPEIKEFGLPYLVYGYSESPTPYSNERISGNIVFFVYSTNFSKMSEITNIIAAAFERDDASKNVNEYSSTIPAFIGIRFGYINVAAVDGGTPEDNEGGNMNAMVSLSYEYYADYDVQVSFSTWDEESQTYVQS